MLLHGAREANANGPLDDRGHLATTVALNRDGIEQLRQGLAKLGVRAPASAGNFVLADLGRPAAATNEALLRRGVIVRPVGNYGLANHLRISTGTVEQNARLLTSLEAALAATA